jgi:predicted nucleic acid-binding protein
LLLLENSAWARVGQQHVDEARLAEIANWMANGEIAICLPFLLEAGYSARSSTEHQTMMSDLRQLRSIQITPRIETRALQAQSELAHTGHHRIPPGDLIVAACADDAAGSILHYDTDFDIIIERTSLTFESVWLAPRGSL